MNRIDELKAVYPNQIPVQELRARVSIIELAQHYGYQPQPKKGKNRPVLTHPMDQDTILIKHPQHPRQQLYQRVGDFTDAGTIIDFIRTRLTTRFALFNQPHVSEFRQILNVLYDYLQMQPDQRVAQQPAKTTQTLLENTPGFDCDQLDLRPLETDNYLIRRHIAPQTLQSPEFANKILTQITYYDTLTQQALPLSTVKAYPERHYQQFANVAFPYYNDNSPQVTGLELRNEGIKLHAPGSDRTRSVFVSNPPPKVENFVVTESVIDALSFHQLRCQSPTPDFKTVYFATGGAVTPQQVHTIVRYVGGLAKAPTWRLRLAFDNDPQGHYYDLLFIQQLAAGGYPLAPTQGLKTHISYKLPTAPMFGPIQQDLLRWVDRYNQAVLVPTRLTVGGKQNMTTGPAITLIEYKDQLTIRLLKDSLVLSAFCATLLQLTGLSERILIDKAVGKDFNEDLTHSVKATSRLVFPQKQEKGR